jgi:hypothetical protein
MLFWLADLAPFFSPLNVFRYITVRTGGAAATALFFVFFFGPRIISALRLKQGKGQPIRADGPQSHLLTKKGIDPNSSSSLGNGFAYAWPYVQTLLIAQALPGGLRLAASQCHIRCPGRPGCGDHRDKHINRNKNHEWFSDGKNVLYHSKCSKRRVS